MRPMNRMRRCGCGRRKRRSCGKNLPTLRGRPSGGVRSRWARDAGHAQPAGGPWPGGRGTASSSGTLPCDGEENPAARAVSSPRGESATETATARHRDSLRTQADGMRACTHASWLVHASPSSCRTPAETGALAPNASDRISSNGSKREITIRIQSHAPATTRWAGGRVSFK